MTFANPPNVDCEGTRIDASRGHYGAFGAVPSATADRPLLLPLGVPLHVTNWQNGRVGTVPLGPDGIGGVALGFPRKSRRFAEADKMM
jgi:hypothetical protein